LAAVILAAGASERMGSPKALLAWGSGTLLDYALHQAHSAGIETVVVVLGPATRHLERELAEVTTAFNPEPTTGRSASIRLGCEALPDDLEAVVIQSVDQPCTSEVLVSVLTALTAGDADGAIPVYQGRRGHPVCFAGRLLAELRNVNEQDQGLRAIVRGHAERLLEVPVGTESVVWNLNDPVAYAAARASAGQM
jgi:molybdenum cofactor cytidylyltransferase